MIVNILPLYSVLMYPDLNETLFGVIIGAYEASNLIFSFVLGTYLQMIGRKNSMIIGLIICLLGTLGLGLVSLSENEWLFFWLSTLLRFISGAGNTLYLTAGFAIISTEFCDDIEKYLAIATLG